MQKQLQGNCIYYRGKNYRVQTVKGWHHIIVTSKGHRQRIGISQLQPVNDCVFNYVFGGQFQTHPCPAMDYWIYRHRMGNKITTIQYKQKFNIKQRRQVTN